MITEAIILAGGFGTRLQSVVDAVPKSLAPVNDIPFIAYLINSLQKKGVQRFIFSLGYKHQTITAYIDENYPSLEKVYEIETEPLGTGGAIAAACKKAKGNTVLVINGDTFYDINLKSFSHFHANKAADCSIALKPMINIERYGTVDINNRNTVIAFNEKRFCQNGLINGGMYLLNVRNFLQEQLPRVFSFEKQYLQNLFSVRPMFGIIMDDYFIDIGVPEDYERAQQELGTGN